ncbi:MAG: type II toxin-antitoxin system HicA family toxin [bacterium]
MNKLYLPKAKNLEKILLFLGFIKTRQKGSHIFYKHPDGRVTTVPYHKGKDITRLLLRAILREIDLSTDEFDKIREKI